jgi:arylsulfatase A-like enzyme
MLSSCRLGIAAAFAIAYGTVAPAAEPAQRPSVLFILSDDQRWDTIRALGNPEIRTPTLDKLVESGFRFNNAYCMGSMVPAVCLPSRTMIFTGQSLWKATKNQTLKAAPEGVPLLPVVFNQAGYVTFHMGKASNSPRYAHAAFATNIETKKVGPNDACEHADRVIQFLDDHQGDKPFFIYLAPCVPHDPRVAPPEFHRMYDPAKITLSKNFMPNHPFDNGELMGRDEKLAAHPRTEAEMKQHLADYYACITDLDRQVGRILDALRKRDFAKNTMVIFSSDQGLAVGGRHGLMGKQNLYEHVKPPLIFAGPGIKPGQSDALVYLFDLFPTLCDFAGISIPDAVEGKSLRPIIEGKKPLVRETLFGAFREFQRMVRDDRWKLIKYNAGGVRNVQLFDLKNDADELHNLAADPKYVEQLVRLEKLLAEARKQFGDPVDFK